MKRWTPAACAFATLALLWIANPVLLHGAAPRSTDPFGGKHVLVIGIDGCRSDALQAAKAPNLKALAESGTVCWRGFAGGALGTKTQQVTISGPGWSSILTGVWANKHHVVDNKFTAPNLKKIVDGKIVGYPPFFTRIRERCPECYLASIVNWNPINEHIVCDVDHEDHGDDAAVAKKCAELLLGGKNPSVVFLQFDEVDGAGHSKTYGPASPGYMESIETVDRHVGTVLDAMRKRPNFAREDWLVLVVADHGGIEKKHGGQAPEERAVCMIASGGGYPHQVLEPEWGIVAIAPTVLRHLGISVDPAWGLESAPFGSDCKP